MYSYAIWDLSPPLLAASSRSGCRTVITSFLRVRLVCVFLLSVITDSARLLSFRRPNRGDLVSIGFVQRVPPFYHRRFRPPPFTLSNRGYICDSSYVCALLTPTKELVIYIMVILRFRASLCCILGSILSCIFRFYSDLPPPVPLVPVLACLLYTSPSPRDGLLSRMPSSA